MDGNVFKGVEIVGTSSRSFSHAIEVAVERARQTLRNLSWFVVREQRGGLQQGRLEYQVTLCVYFKLDAGESPATTGDEQGRTQEARKPSRKKRA
ncbi:MAG TPA: dodecin family protein [Pyrinomonadaceae bacterium]|jgi:flavin-binding protein dodecin|nr:dodecin family protein [Pyrinomonadaceae bacterium]